MTVFKMLADIKAAVAEDEEQRDQAIRAVYDTFATDLRQGYVTNDKVYAVAMLGKALGLPIRVEAKR